MRASGTRGPRHRPIGTRQNGRCAMSTAGEIATALRTDSGQGESQIDQVSRQDRTAQNSIRAPIERERARNRIHEGMETGFLFSQLGDSEGLTWAWKAYLAHAHVTILTGLWKAGKTTLVAHLLKEFGKGGELAGRVEPTRVLVITEESQRLWVRRRDEMGIGDHVHVVCRPFAGRPRMAGLARTDGRNRGLDHGPRVRRRGV